VFRYRAIRKSHSQSLKWFLFQLKDCPALLWDDAFFLVGKPETPIMLFNTVVRGHPKINMFEGDKVFNTNTNKEIGIVVYCNGFYMQKVGDPIKKVIPKRHIYVRKGDTESMEALMKFNRTPIVFKYLNTEFDFGDLVAVEGDVLNLIVQGKPQRVNLNGVTELIYYDEEKEYRGYEGDIFDGRFLTLESIASIKLD
jgi:hypothetical protein